MVIYITGWHYETGVFVNLILEGNNYLRGGSGPGLAWAGAKPNLNGVKDGSTLIIDGNGKLEAYGGNMEWTSAIGNSYSGGDAGGEVNNIIINGGNIKATGSANGAGIGSVIGGKANNIIINSGHIETIGGRNISGISVSDNLIINGGELVALKNWTCPGISSAETVKITGGRVVAYGDGSQLRWGYKGDGIYGNKIIITGGTIEAISNKCAGISCKSGGSVQISGGNIMSTGEAYKVATYEENSTTLVSYTPTDGANNLYETQIKLPDVGENKKVTKFTTSDNIEYGIKDMYTLENGMLYLYLPTGTRTITIEVDGKTYSGSVQTTETPEEVTLNEIN